jgi:membrane-associated phospholipid phosphatase
VNAGDLPASTAVVAARFARWLDEAERLDVAIYAAIASTPTPTIDRVMRGLSRAADYSRLSLASAAVLAVAGGRRGRRAAVTGLASVSVAATVTNLLAKPLGRRRRPDRIAQEVLLARHVRMPVSSSFPSGHSTAAFAFATGVAHASLTAAVPLYALATLVAYSRIHSGVHYPATSWPDRYWAPGSAKPPPKRSTACSAEVGASVRPPCCSPSVPPRR